MGDRTVEEGLIAREYDWKETVPSIAVVKTVAAIERVDPTNLPPLYEYIDPDALDAVIDSGANMSISFSAFGYTVKVVDSTVIVCNH